MKYFLAFALSFIVITSNAQSNFATVSYGTSSYQSRDIFFGDSGYVYVTGQCLIRGTTNNEQYWSGYCYTVNNIFGGASPALANTFVVGEGGLISKNSACEIFGSWYNQNSGTTDTLYSVKFFDMNHGVVVGEAGTTLVTSNNGTNWANIATGNSSSLYNMIIKPNNTLVACGGNGTIIQSSDSGLTWQLQTTGITSRLTDLSFPTNDTGYAVGVGGLMIKTTDGGSNWQVVSTGIISKLNGVDFYSANSGTIVGDDGVIFKTNDGGLTWTAFPYSTFYDVFDIQYKDSLNGYLLTTYETYRTRDGGNTWYDMGSNLETVSYFTDDVMICAGDNGLVRRSTDGGMTWNEMHPDANVTWYTSNCPSADTGYIAGLTGHMIKTTDGGLTWTPQTTNPPSGSSAFFGMHFFDNDHGIAVGSPWMISRTTNGGQTWVTNSNPNSSVYGYYDVFFIDSQVGWICGSQGTIRKTTDGGATFVNQPTSITDYLQSIFFLDSLKGFVVGGSGKLLRTTDGGTTWLAQSLGTATLRCVTFEDSLHGFIGVDNSYMYETVNGGQTWVLNSILGTPYEIKFRKKYQGYFVGGGDMKAIYDPIKGLNAFSDLCRGQGYYILPRIAPNLPIQQGNIFVFEMDTTGSDFNDAVFISAVQSDTSGPYLSLNIPTNISAGYHHGRIRATGISPISTSITSVVRLGEDPVAKITFLNDTLFTPFNSLFQYQWYQGITTISGATQHYYVPAGPGNYRVNVSYGCCTYAYDNLTISTCGASFIQAPVVSGLYNNLYYVTCDSSSATLIATGATSYRWYDSDTSTNILSTDSFFVTPVIIVNDSFYVSAVSGSCESDRVLIIMNHVSKPLPPSVTGDTACEGSEAFLFSSSNYANWYSDSLNSNSFYTGNAFHISHLMQADTFYVSELFYQCESNRVPVIVTALPAPVPQTLSGDTILTPSALAAYYYTPAIGNTIQWFVNNGNILSTTDSAVVQWNSSDGRIGVIETNATGCSTDTIWLNVDVDILNRVLEIEASELSVSPNPSKDKLEVKCDENIKLIQIIAPNGTLIKSIKSEGKQHIIHLYGIAPGNYILKSLTSKGKWLNKEISIVK